MNKKKVLNLQPSKHPPPCASHTQGEDACHIKTNKPTIYEEIFSATARKSFPLPPLPRQHEWISHTGQSLYPLDGERQLSRGGATERIQGQDSAVAQRQQAGPQFPGDHQRLYTRGRETSAQHRRPSPVGCGLRRGGSRSLPLHEPCGRAASLRRRTMEEGHPHHRRKGAAHATERQPTEFGIADAGHQRPPCAAGAHCPPRLLDAALRTRMAPHQGPHCLWQDDGPRMAARLHAEAEQICRRRTLP